MRALLLALLCACDAGPDGPSHGVDAPVASIDAPGAMTDAPFSCMPFAPAVRAPGPLCPALQSETLVGDAPFGHLQVALDNFTAGDCITISQAVITWGGTCLEQLTLSFPYPVTSDGTRRSVTQSFDTDARFDYRPPGWAPSSDVTTIHVDVVTWQEGVDSHQIDITVTVTDTRYALAPIHVVGTFCEWAYLLC